MNKSAHKNALTIGAIFLIIGLLLGAACVFVSMENHRFQSRAIKTQGIITNTEWIESHDDDDDDYRSITVSFETEDREIITGSYDYSDNFMDTGDIVTVYYDPNNPEKFRSGKVSSMMTVIMSIIGIIFGGIGLLLILNIKIGGRSKKKLMETGQLIYARVTKIEKSGWSVNGHVGSYVYAQATDAFSDVEYKSGNIYLNQNVSSEENYETLPLIPIYIDQKDHKKYYMDIQTWTSGLSE
ncbi:MAG: DUF3592 domain-containing protein [Clostridium sp.]|jgi:major membrane immunogen (membrane-anchored lipoprotein)|nr:DUF3592 domain-containing protein [Clostridium sp.]